MANHPQAEKRNRQRLKRQAHHRHYRATMRTMVKRVRSAVDDENKDKANETLKKAVPLLDRCAQKGVLPKKRAARTISRLTRAVNALAK